MRPVHAALAAGLIGCCTASHAVAQAAGELRVELSSFAFSPRELHLRAGQPTTLVLANLGSGGHDFAAPEFFAAARLQPGDAGLVVEGEVEVPARSVRTIHLVPAAGRYKLTCTHTFHTMFGMKGTIVVE